MLLTISTTHRPATDLGFLLVKHPDRVQSFETTGGLAHVFYPEADPERCTAALLLEVDPVALARPAKGHRAPESFALGQYVNDRPYAASSLLAVALGRVFRSALKGASAGPAGAGRRALPLEITVSALPCRGGAEVVERLFGPLGWSVTATPVPLDARSRSGATPGTCGSGWSAARRLADALNHLYVLLPVLDDAKHYWVARTRWTSCCGPARAGWPTIRPGADHPPLPGPPPRADAECAGPAARRVGRAGDRAPLDPEQVDLDTVEAAERRRPLVRLRTEAVLAALREPAAARVLDLGCGQGALVRGAAGRPRFTEIVGVDVSSAGAAHRRAPAAAGPDAGAAARPDHAAPAALTYTTTGCAATTRRC